MLHDHRLCQHCGRDSGPRYTMSTDSSSDFEYPRWAISAIVLVVCLAVICGYAVLR